MSTLCLFFHGHWVSPFLGSSSLFYSKSISSSGRNCRGRGRLPLHTSLGIFITTLHCRSRYLQQPRMRDLRLLRRSTIISSDQSHISVMPREAKLTGRSRPGDMDDWTTGSRGLDHLEQERSASSSKVLPDPLIQYVTVPAEDFSQQFP
ncbi:hypothetical protein BR93DRAFT_126707 [Coniochaeta sp. PMI_546]|nr:hypothetical protein BR93DRAFT_126707 [Coniochaeta sp. PMI_546]